MLWQNLVHPVPPAAHATPAYAVSNNGTTLIRFDTATPSIVSVVGAFSGATSNLDGLDFRPANNLLYGYSDATDSVYTVNLSTGATTLVTGISAPTSIRNLGIDFNPAADRLRIVNSVDENLRVNVAGGATLVDGTLAYAPGDANVGANPNIVDAAYTNSDRNPATGTTLYYIDYVLDILVSTSNPNGGVLNTVGALGIDTSVFLGFDILSDGFGGNLAFASLTNTAGVPSLYSINLSTGAATLIGGISASSVYGLALVPVFIPEPGSMALFGLAGMALVTARRRRV